MMEPLALGPDWLWTWGWLTLPPWLMPAFQGFLLGALLEMLRHHRSLVKMTDLSEKGVLTASLLNVAVTHAKEEGYWEELEPRLDDRAEEVGIDLALLRHRHEGWLERAIRRWWL